MLHSHLSLVATVLNSPGSGFPTGQLSPRPWWGEARVCTLTLQELQGRVGVNSCLLPLRGSLLVTFDFRMSP